MKSPIYYIKSSEIKRVKNEIAKSIEEFNLAPKYSFNPIKSYNAFVECFDRNIDILLNKKALFATDESKKEVKKHRD